MTRTKVATGTDKSERVEKAPTDLEPGDWIAPGWLTGEGYSSAAAEVLSAHRYADATSNDKVLIVYREVGDSNVETIRWFADRPVELASAEEVEQARADARRHATVDQLYELGRLIAERKLPLPERYEAIRVSFRFGRRNVDLVEGIGKALGIEPRTSYGTMNVTWPPNRDYAYDLVIADWSTSVPTEPKSETADDPTGNGFSRTDVEDDTADAVPSGVDGTSMSGRPVSGIPATE